MPLEIIEQILTSEWSVFLTVGGLLLLASFIGYLMGLRVFRCHDEVHKSLAGNYPAIILSILGLLLGFTFSMGVARFDVRRVLVVDETNAIGTTYLRTSFLPPAQRDSSRDLLREYVGLRLALRLAPREFEQLRVRSAAIQQSLWRDAETSVGQVPEPIFVSYFTSLNQMIDLEATRVAESRAHIPAAVWLLLILVSLFAMWSTGYSAGTAGRRAIFPLVALPLLITLIITLVSDLTRPKVGFISTDQRSLEELRATMEPSADQPG